MSGNTKLLIGAGVVLVALVYAERIGGLPGFQLTLAGGDPSQDTLAQSIKAAQLRQQAWSGGK